MLHCSQLTGLPPGGITEMGAMFDKTAGLALATATAFAFTTTVSEAGRFKRGYNEGNYVVAESEYGNGRVAGPVRHTRLGRQVRLPGGSWVYCSKSCAETLRVKTVDFWQSDEGAGTHISTTQDGGSFGNLGLIFGRE